MKIIDEEGRLFSKWNIIDVLVVLFFLLLTPNAFYFGYKIMNKPTPRTPETITLNKVEYEKEKAEHERLKAKRDRFLREHKGARRKYF